VASLSQGRTAAAQCGLFTHKSVPVIFEPPCMLSLLYNQDGGDQCHLLQCGNWIVTHSFIKVIPSSRLCHALLRTKLQISSNTSF